MESVEESSSRIAVSVENIGGISHTSIGLGRGVTVLTGRNATNRTSLLRAIMAAMGSDAAAVKGDASEGHVAVEIDGTTYTRTLSRQGGETVFGGDPFLEDAQLANLFAFLLETNDARMAVQRNEDLYDVIMRPVDTAEIEARIADLKAERQRLDDELQEINELAEELPDLEERRTALKAEIGAKRDELETKRAALETLEHDEDLSAELEERFQTLREAENDLEETRHRLKDERRILESLREERADIESRLDGLAAADEAEQRELESALEEERDAVQRVESMLSNLQSVIQFNESLVVDDDPAFMDALVNGRTAGDVGSVTDMLLADGQEGVCWTCGSEVQRGEIEGMVELLREVHRDLIERRNELREEIDQLEDELKHLERVADERTRLERELDELEADIEDRADRIADLQVDTETFEEAMAQIESDIEELEAPAYDDLLAHNRQVNELEYELGRLERELDDVTDDIEMIETRLEDWGELEDRREDLTAEMESLRTRIDRLETEAVEEFNDQMDRILDLLEFENLERVWIERLETEVKEGRQMVTKPTFDLHVVRTAESGPVYEDTINHLSESEREVVGLAFALSGYLVHEVYEQVPFMLLDSLEALDADRISVLIDHLADQASNLVVALLPEDAAAVNDTYHRITDI